MSRRAEWKKILDAEVNGWSSKSCDQMLAQLHDKYVYTVEVESKVYQIEVQLLENTATYIHVAVSVDDRSLTGSMFPSSTSFISRKDGNIEDRATESQRGSE
jgi:hypothetical protein